MQHMLEFILHHWVLWSMLAVVFLLLLRSELTQSVSGILLLSPQEVTKRINHDHAVILDIRDKDQYQGGHIIGAVNIPVSGFSDQIKTLNKFKTKPIIVSCQNGQQSPAIGATLKKNAFQEVFALKGGIQAWQGEQLPLVKVNMDAANS